MATYTDLYAINDSAWRNRVEVAVLTTAYKILMEATPVAERVAWAKSAVANPATATAQIAKMIIVKTQNDIPTVTVDTILSAADTDVQPYVDSTVTLLIGA